jgi:GNAT superfamily N-acetyltransferase
MEILSYNRTHETQLFDLIHSDPEWSEYLQFKQRYIQALEQSVVFMLMDKDVCIGFIRGKDDSGFGFYVYDLLVRKDNRGHGYGKALIDHVRSLYQPVYVMSDVDAYYEKIGMTKIGSIFE